MDTIRRMGLRWRTLVDGVVNTVVNSVVNGEAGSVEQPRPATVNESEKEMVALRTSMMRVLHGFPAAKEAVLKMFRDLMRAKNDPWWADVEAEGLAYVDA